MSHLISSDTRAVRVVLVDDVLHQVFALLQADDIADWDRNRGFAIESRTLCSCVLVSRAWRNVGLQYLFRDMVVTHGSVVRQNCAKAGHPMGCVSCGCSCHRQETDRIQRELPTFLQFLRDTPHPRQYTCGLWIRTSPLVREERNDRRVDAQLLLDIIQQLPQVASLYLEDVILTLPNSPLSSSLPTIPPLQQLTLQRNARYTIADVQIIDILSCFSRIDRLRIIGAYHDTPPDSLRPFPAASDLQLGCVVFEECSITSEQVFQYLATAAAGPSSLELTAVRTESAMRGLRTLLTHAREQLIHFGYRVRSSGTLSALTLFIATALPDLIPRPAVSLVGCTSLQSVDVQLNLHSGALGSDLRKDVIPMLSSLLPGPRGKLTQITFKSWVIEDLHSHIENDSVHTWISRLEDVLMQLCETRGVKEISFRLEDDENRQDVAAENFSALRDALPRLGASGIMRVVIYR